MSDREHTRLMLDMAWKDFRAMEGMMNRETFADEIFDFHGQQTVEKASKAWASLLGAEYPRTHDLDLLISDIEDGAQIVPEVFRDLVHLTDFAVQFRYGPIGLSEAPLDREALLNQIREF